jgi:hypothetical protein
MSLTEVKGAWLSALEEATAFVASRPPEDIGCVYLDAAGHAVAPAPGAVVQRHFGRPGGVVPRIGH